MPMIAKVRTHTISKNITLSTSGYNLVGAGSPAIEAMTDFLRVNLVTIGASESLVDANARMISRGVRMLIVSAPDDGVLGLITARDIMGEKPMQLAQSRGCKRDELRVADLMTPDVAKVQTHDRGVELIAVFSNGHLRHLPVVNPQGKLVGMVTQTDLIREMARTLAQPEV